MIPVLHDRTVFPGPYDVKRSDVDGYYAVFDNPSVDYTLEFTIKLELNLTLTNPRNLSVIHLTTSGNCCAYGDRVPAIWLNDGKLLVFTGTNDNGNLSIYSERTVNKAGVY